MESTTVAPTQGRAIDAPTVTEALRRTAAAHPGIVAVRTPDDSVSLTWGEFLARVDAVAGGLAKLGVGRGDTVAIMLGNRPEFNVVDLATRPIPPRRSATSAPTRRRGWRSSSRRSWRRSWRCSERFRSSST